VKISDLKILTEADALVCVAMVIKQAAMVLHLK